MNESNYDQRQSMLSVPARWSDLYFDIFTVLSFIGVVFVLYYEAVSRQPDESVADVAAGILLRLAAVPIVAALLAYLIMRGRDWAMKTWETFKQERFESGVEVGVKRGREEGRVEGREEGIEEGREEGIEEGIEIGTRRAIREIRERLARREAAERGERDDWLDEILSELSANGSGGNSDTKERGA